MSDLPEAGKAAHGLDHVVRGLSARFIDHKNSVEWRRLRLSRHLDFAAPDLNRRWRGGHDEPARPSWVALRFLRLLHFLQKFVDVLSVFSRLINHKQNFGRAPQLQSLN